MVKITHTNFQKSYYLNNITSIFFSETGKVLTQMKAGDFFGEIGILNLDGFNRYKV